MISTRRTRWTGTLAAAGLAAAALASAARAEGVPRLDHVIVVVMENKSYAQTTNPATAPYTASLIASYSSFASSYAITHPSQPNYLALWAASTMSVTNDACPPFGSPYAAENLGHACEVAGKTWKAYSEDLPAAGSMVCTWNSSSYTRKHDPWTDFSNLNHLNERPYPDLAAAIAAYQLPDLAFVVPNNCHNTHDCSVTTGDTWLANQLPAMISAVGSHGLVVLTWDEDDFSSTNRILTVFASPLVRAGYLSPRHITHYTLVRTLCEALRIAPFAGAIAETAITDVWRPELVGVAPPSLARLALDPPVPNPMRGTVALRLRLPAPALVAAGVHDVAGRIVRDLGSEFRAAESLLRWDGRDDSGRAATPGLYFVRVRVGETRLERPVVRLE